MPRSSSGFDLGKSNKAYEAEVGSSGVAAGSYTHKDGTSSSKGAVQEEELGAKVGWREMFRFADCGDSMLMILGAFLAACHGTLYIVSNLVLGAQIDTFIDYQKGINYVKSKDDVWRKYGTSSEEVWKNRSIIGIVAAQEPNRTDLNVSFIPRPEITDDFFLNEMLKYTVAYLIMGAIALVAAFGQITFWVIPAERQVRRIRTAFLKATLRQEVGWYDRLGSGELNTRLSDDMTKIVDGMGDKFGTFIQLFACFVVAFIQGFAIGWKLSLVMLVIVPALIGAALLASLLNANLTNQELKAYAKAGKVAEEVLGSIRTVSAFGGEKRECDRYTVNLFAARNKGIRKGLVLGLGMGVAWFILYGSYALGFWFGAKLIIEDSGNYTPGKLLVVFFSILTGAVAIGQAGPKMQAISTARGACYTIFRIIDREPEIDSFSDEGLRPNRVVGNIEFREVKFRYPTRPDVEVLGGMDLKVNVGQTVALVGSSGCGKSTSVALLQRFYDIESGSVMIDGVDVRQLNIKWLRQNIGVVSQEPILFGTTIAENIRYGREGVTMAEIEQATKEANAYNFICKLPERFDTMVGERGAQLSGGQKQRIAIARALVRNPKILLLDEATSALDTESEAIVQAALDKASQGRTTIVIAHRLSTVRNADLICGFKKGVIVEKGNHDQLMQVEGGIYQQLVTLQTRQAEMDAQAGVVEDEKKVDPDDVAEVLARSPSVTEDIPLERTKSFTESLKGSLRASMRSLKRVGMALKMQRLEDEELSELSRFQLEIDPKVPPAPVSRIARLNAPEWFYITLGCIASLMNGAENPVFAMVFSWLLGVFLQAQEDQMKLASQGCILFLIIGVFVAIAQFGMNYFFAQSGERLTMRLRQMAFQSMLRQDISWYDDHSNNLGALTTRLATESSSVQGATGSRLGLVLQNISNIGVGIIIAFTIQWRLTLVMLAFIPLIAITGLVEARVLKGSAGTDKKNLEKAGKVALEAIENIRTVAALTKEQHFYEEYNKMLELPFKNSMRKAYVLGIAFSLSQSILYVAFAIAFYYGTFLIKDGLSEFSDVFMVVAVIIFGAMGIGETIAFAPDYTKARVAASKLFSLIDRVPPIDVANTSGLKPASFTGKVSLRDVRFRYPTRPEVAVLRGIEFAVTPGQTVALVGSSGCGKSTSVSLVERFYEALMGEVMFDGYNVRDLNLEWLRRQVGIVSQEPSLFDATIAENIAYGDNFRDVTMEEIIQAAKNSNIHNFIASLPLGYETRVGDRGTQLSGGQKQRVAIARALLRNPKVLLLDEATSALDTESERIVQEALDKARAGRTCIVIAHRLSTVQDADQICVFHLGKIVERGRHEELLQLQGLYWNLHQVQAKKGKDS